MALTLARPEGAPEGTKGLAMFLVPKYLENGEHNKFRINRLKEKFGTRDMASGEITFEGAKAYLVGELNTGFKQMMSMVNSSRFSNAVRSAGLMRRAFLEAVVVARGRIAFGRPLIALPLMRTSIFELLMDAEAALSVILHTADAFDKADAGEELYEKLFRILTPITKGYICKRARYVTSEAMEIRGGNGYIEDWVDSKLVRDAHVGSIWEGTTNIVSLDVLRAIRKNQADAAFFQTIDERLASLKNEQVRRAARLLKPVKDRLQREITVTMKENEHYELYAKKFMNHMYHLLAASLFLQEADHQLERDGNYRKLFLYVQYFNKYIDTTVDRPVFDEQLNEWLYAVIDWEPVGRDALEPLIAELEKSFSAV